MKKSPAIAIITAALLLTGCVVTSVYPFYTAKDVAFDPGLLGTWTNVETAGEAWKFEREGTNAYQLTTTSQSDTNVMPAHRFKIGSEFFLDIATSQGLKDSEPPPIPSHVVLWLPPATNNALQIAVLDYEWLEKELTNNPHALRHYVVDSEDKEQGGRLVLTADTPELQKFITKSLKSEEAWKQRLNLKREGAAEK